MRTPSFSDLSQALFLVSSVAAASCVPGSSFSPGEPAEAEAVAPGDEAVAKVSASAAAPSGGSGYMVTVGGISAYAHSMSGGGITLEVSKSPGPKYVKKSVIANPGLTYEPITLEV